MKATLVIMAAGMGSRYGGEKQTDGIGPHGEAIMEYSVYDAVRALSLIHISLKRSGQTPTPPRIPVRWWGRTESPAPR